MVLCRLCPTKIKVPRGKHDDNVIEIKKENYKPQQIKLTSRFSIGYLILDMVSGLWPIVIDIATGSIYAPYPKKINYYLEPQNHKTQKP